MPLKTLKLTCGIKWEKEPPPVFIEGEEPGVFVTQIMKVDVPEDGGGMFAMWLLEREEELLRDHVQLKWKEKVDE